MRSWLGVLALVACGDGVAPGPDASVLTTDDGRGLVREGGDDRIRTNLHVSD